MKVAAGYIIIINLIAFLVMRLDKKRAIQRRYRIPEKTLWYLSIAGGASGTMVAMHLFRHKTRRYIFLIGLPVLVLIQVTGLYWLISILY